MNDTEMVLTTILAGYLHNEPQRGKSGFWTFDYYQQYFDVDTRTVSIRQLQHTPQSKKLMLNFRS